MPSKKKKYNARFPAVSMDWKRERKSATFCGPELRWVISFLACVHTRIIRGSGNSWVPLFHFHCPRLISNPPSLTHH